MSKNVDFEVGTIVTDKFLDSLQELLTGAMHNVRLSSSLLGGDRVTMAVTGDVINDKRATMNIQGRYVYTDVSKDSNASGTQVDGPKDIYLSTTANGTPQQPNFDINVDIAGLPPAASYIRKIGSATKASGILTRVKLSNGLTADADQYNEFAFRSIMNLSGETLLTLRGQSVQTSPVGADKSDPSGTPTKALSAGTSDDTATVVGTYTERFYMDSMGRMVWVDVTNGLPAVLQWNAGDGSADDSSILVMNRILGSYREGENALAAQDNPTLDGVQVNYTRNRGLNSLTTRALDADTFDRFELSSTGIVQWGSGSAAVDTGFYRVTNDALAMLPGDRFYMDYTIIKATDTGKLATNKEYVDAEIATAISESKRFAFFITP